MDSLQKFCLKTVSLGYGQGNLKWSKLATNVFAANTKVVPSKFILTHLLEELEDSAEQVMGISFARDYNSLF